MTRENNLDLYGPRALIAGGLVPVFFTITSLCWGSVRFVDSLLASGHPGPFHAGFMITSMILAFFLGLGFLAATAIVFVAFIVAVGCILGFEFDR